MSFLSHHKYLSPEEFIAEVDDNGDVITLEHRIKEQKPTASIINIRAGLFEVVGALSLIASGEFKGYRVYSTQRGDLRQLPYEALRTAKNIVDYYLYKSENDYYAVEFKSGNSRPNEVIGKFTNFKRIVEESHINPPKGFILINNKGCVKGKPGKRLFITEKYMAENWTHIGLIPILHKTLDMADLKSCMPLGNDLREAYSEYLHAHGFNPIIKDKKEPKDTKYVDTTIQRNAVDAARNAYTTGDTRINMNIFPRLGKTLITFRLATDIWNSGGRLVIFAVPSLALIKQVRKEYQKYARGAGQPQHLVINVSSYRSKNKEDDITTLNKAVVRKLEADFDRFKDEKRILCLVTYHSSALLAKYIKDNGVTVDLFIADEAHKLVGSKKGKRKALMDAAIRPQIKKYLFVTGTPKVVRIKPNAENLVLSMDNVNEFGECIARASFRDGLAAPLYERRVCAYDIAVFMVNSSELENLKNNITIAKYPNITHNNLMAIIALEKIIREDVNNKRRRIVTYSSNIKNAKQFQALVQERFKGEAVRCDVVTCNTNSDKRKDIFKQFKESDIDGRHIICNVDVLSEGITLKTADTIVFCDPIKSLSKTVQASARALGAYGDKRAMIVVPCFVNDDEPFTALSKKHRQTLDTLYKIGITDDSIISYVDMRLQEGIDLHPGGDMTSVSPPSVMVMGASTEIEIEEVYKAIRIGYVEYNGVSHKWQQEFDEAKQYFDTHLPPYTYDCNIDRCKEMHKWINRQYKNTLQDVQLDKLQTLTVWNYIKENGLLVTTNTWGIAWVIYDTLMSSKKKCFKSGDIKKNHKNSRIVVHGKEPHQTISACITENLAKKKGLIVAIKEGVYKLAGDRTLDQFKNELINGI